MNEALLRGHQLELDKLSMMIVSLLHPANEYDNVKRLLSHLLLFSTESYLHEQLFLFHFSLQQKNLQHISSNDHHIRDVQPSLHEKYQQRFGSSFQLQTRKSQLNQLLTNNQLLVGSYYTWFQLILSNV